MGLPADLVQEIEDVCSTQQIESREPIRAVHALIGEDTVLDHAVWGGPGYSQENLVLDVYVLGSWGLYNYAVHRDKGETAGTGGCTFLDELGHVSIMKVPYPRSPHVLAMVRGSLTTGLLFGGEDDLSRLEHFRQNLIAARAKLFSRARG